MEKEEEVLSRIKKIWINSDGRTLREEKKNCLRELLNNKTDTPIFLLKKTVFRGLKKALQESQFNVANEGNIAFPRGSVIEFLTTFSSAKRRAETERKTQKLMETENILQNPWSKITIAERILSPDRNLIYEYNQMIETERIKAQKSAKIITELLPVPFVGNPLSPALLLLMTNPGYSEGDVELQNGNPEYRTAGLANLNINSQHPSFFPLSDQFEGTPAYSYYCDHFGTFLKEIDDPDWPSFFDTRLGLIQFFPYHSESEPVGFFRLHSKNNIAQILPGQKYQFNLVKKAIRNRTPIIILRSITKWKNCVPELRGYLGYIEPKSKRNAYLSENNLPPGIFNAIVNCFKKFQEPDIIRSAIFNFFVGFNSGIYKSDSSFF